jgi:hypothetical protein
MVRELLSAIARQNRKYTKRQIAKSFKRNLKFSLIFIDGLKSANGKRMKEALLYILSIPELKESV